MRRDAPSLAAVLVLVLLAACSRAPTEEAALELREVPAPDLSQAEEAVRQQIE